MLDRVMKVKDNVVGSLTNGIDKCKKPLSNLSAFINLIYSLAFAIIAFTYYSDSFGVIIFTVIFIATSLLDGLLQKFDRYGSFSNFVRNLVRIMLFVASLLVIFLAIILVLPLIRISPLFLKEYFACIKNGSWFKGGLEIIRFVMIPVTLFYGLYSIIDRYLSRPNYKSYSVYNSRRGKIIHKHDEYEDVDASRDISPHLSQLIVCLFTKFNFVAIASSFVNILGNFVIPEDGKFLTLFIPLCFAISLSLFMGASAFRAIVLEFAKTQINRIS